MPKINSDLLIEVSIIEYKEIKKTVQIIRKYNDLPMSEIIINLKSKGVIYSVELYVREYYLGWEFFIDLVNELLFENVSLKITVNKEEVSVDFIDELKVKVNRISRGDIY